MTASSPHVLVVGAGLAGLVSGWRLAQRGASVTLLDAASAPGGRLRGVRREGFELTPGFGTLSEADWRLGRLVMDLGLGDAWQPLRPVVTEVVHERVPCQVPQWRAGGLPRIPGVGWRERLRLLRLPRLMRRYAEVLAFEDPAGAAPLDDRSLVDFGRLYLGSDLIDRWLALRVERSAPGDLHEMSRVQFLIESRRRGSERVGLPRTGIGELLEPLARPLSIRLGTPVLAVSCPASRGARVDTEAGRLEADALVLATDAGEAARLADGSLVSAECSHLAGVRYAPLLSVAAGLCRPFGARPREIWVPRSEASPLARVLLEPGLPGGRVPAGRGLAWLRARGAAHDRLRTLPDDALGKSLLEALDRLIPGWLRSVDFSQVFRVERAAPRFDVGHYRALARFEAVQRDRRRQGRRLYFAGDHLVHPSAEGAVVSGERVARDLAGDFGLG